MESGLNISRLPSRCPNPGRQGAAEEALTKLVNVMAAGDVPDYVAPFLCGARLHAGLKKRGGIHLIAGKASSVLRFLAFKHIFVFLNLLQI